jgi:hypothetical protein
MGIGIVVGGQLQHLPGSGLTLELLVTTFVLWSPRWSASCNTSLGRRPKLGATCNNPFRYSAQVGWYLVMMRLGCLGRVRFRCNTAEKTQALFSKNM